MKPSIKQVKDLIPYWIAIILISYAIPPFLHTRSETILALSLVFPLLLSFLSIVYTFRHKPILLYVVSIPVIFSPTVFIYYDSDMYGLLFFGGGYTVICLAACLVGRMIHAISRAVSNRRRKDK